jgi:hypothetical protein
MSEKKMKVEGGRQGDVTGVVAKKMVRKTGGGQASAPQAEKNSGKAVGGRAVSLFLPDCDSL